MELKAGTIMARAFKPMPIILDLIHKNFSSYKNLVLFMGKNGKIVLKNTLKDWDFEYTEKKSLTNKDSFLLNIRNIKKSMIKIPRYRICLLAYVLEFKKKGNN